MASLFLAVACEKVEATEEAASELPELRVQTYDTDFSDATLSEVRVSLKEGALSFETVDDYRQAKRAILNSTPEEIDAWAASIGFSSWASNEREILNRFQNNPSADPAMLLSQAEQERFDVDEEGWLRSRAFSALMSELINTAGILYIENDLNYFWKDRHIMIDEGSPDRLNDISDTFTVNLENGIYVQLLITEEASSSFPSLCSPTSFGVLGKANFYRSQRSETLQDTSFRMNLELQAYYITLALTDGKEIVEYGMTMEVQNRKKVGNIWLEADVETEMGLLSAINGATASSGEVSREAGDVWRSIRVRRVSGILNPEIQQGGPLSTIEPIGFPTEISATRSLALKVFTGSQGTQLIDDKQIALSIDGADAAWLWLHSYYIERGQLSANWLELSETMDIQIGCPD